MPLRIRIHDSDNSLDERLSDGGALVAFLKPGPNNDGLRGRMGGQVYSGGGADTIVRDYVVPVQPNSPSQQAQKGRFWRGAQGWAGLTDAQRAAWTLAVATLGIKAKGARRQKPRAMTGAQFYTSLTSKFLACSPGGTVPANPPATRFAGDTVAVALTASTGVLTVTANQANKTGVRTEIMVQRLAAAHRKPTPGGYRARAYVAFATGLLTLNLNVAPGAYAVAIQFVNVATGETSGFQVLGQTLVALALEDGGLADADGGELRAADGSPPPREQGPGRVGGRGPSPRWALSSPCRPCRPCPGLRRLRRTWAGAFRRRGSRW